MSNTFFQFKQFRVEQSQCAMKVGTDGVLLGAWADISRGQRLLDVGTGTGLIALMAAQRHPSATITAIDVEQGAIAQASANVAASPWSNRISIIHSSLQTLTAKPFDHIISNPPYFTDSLKAPDAARTLARHADTLSIADLIAHSHRLLTPQGRLSIVVPTDALDAVRQAATTEGLNLSRLTFVKTTPTKAPKRILAELSTLSPGEPSELIIETARHQYSTEFAALVSDFYL